MLTTDHPVALKAALRHDTIRRAIEINGQVSIADLRDRLGVSEVTIREDLKHLESRGVLTRVRGGAVVSRGGAMEMPLEETSTANRAEKAAIAAHAAAMVEDGQTIIVDVGSTTTEMAKALTPELSRVVVITNGLNIALILEALPGVSVIVTGGTLRPLQHSLVAPMGTLLLDQLKADVAFLGCNGVDSTRVRGGAVVSRIGAMEMPLEETSTANRPEKMAIAARAAAMVENGQTIIIDVGSTTTEMAKAFSPELSRVVVITNGLNIALILESLPGVSVIVTGGTLRPLQHSLVAPMGTLLLDQLKADVAFLGCNGVDSTRGFTNTNIAEAEIKQAMVRSATKTVFLADHDKIGEVASAFVADISGADLLITDEGADASVLSNLEGEGLAVEVVRVRRKQD